MPLAIAIDAPNKKVAESIMVGKLWEFYPANGDNYFKPKIWEDSVGQPRPAVGQFDEQFARRTPLMVKNGFLIARPITLTFRTAMKSLI